MGPTQLSLQPPLLATRCATSSDAWPSSGAVFVVLRGDRTTEGKVASCVTGGLGEHREALPRTGRTAHNADTEVASLRTGLSGSQDAVPSILILALEGQFQAFL